MLDTQVLEKYSQSEPTKIRRERDSIVLLSERYNTPNTSLLLFHFEPQDYASSEMRLKNCSISHNTVEDKKLYFLDNFFSEGEAEMLRVYSRNASFSRSSYGTQESREQGEEPARSMDNKEKWEFFAKPPQPIKEIYKLFSYWSHKLNADISTFPWDLCDQKICASAVATNRHERVSTQSMRLGKHDDFNTEKGIPFGIPILYAKDKSFFPGQFVNGAIDNPWLVSFMIYAHEDNFKVPKYGIGTLFYNHAGDVVAKANCKHMRGVLFEGDIQHSIEESHIPNDIKTWRVSYVFKLIINPRQSKLNLKQSMHDLFASQSHLT